VVLRYEFRGFMNLKVGDHVRVTINNIGCVKDIDTFILETDEDLVLVPWVYGIYNTKYNQKCWWIYNDPNKKLGLGSGKVLYKIANAQVVDEIHKPEACKTDKFFLERKEKTMEGIDRKTGETLAYQERGGGLMFL